MRCTSSTGSADGHAEDARGRRSRRSGARPLPGSQHGDAVVGLVQVVDRAGPLEEAFLVQAPEQLGRRPPAGRAPPGLPASEQAIVDAQHRRRPGLHAQGRSLAPRLPGRASKLTHSTCGVFAFRAGPGPPSTSSRGSTWKNWNRKRSSLCRATKVPLPCLRTSMCSCTSSSTALRSVPMLTPSAAARSRSRSAACRPARSWPLSTTRCSSRLTCRYSGPGAPRGQRPAGRSVGGSGVIAGSVVQLHASVI